MLMSRKQARPLVVHSRELSETLCLYTVYVVANTEGLQETLATELLLLYNTVDG